MRTTLTLDDDVVARLEELQRRLGLTFKEAVNQTLRRGLERERIKPRDLPPFTIQARSMGLRRGLNYANVGELLEQVEGVAHP